MTSNIDQKTPISQEQSNEKECFAVFRTPHGLGKGLKSRIKLLNCSWNTPYHGWLCPFAKQEDVQKAFQEANIEVTTQILSMPKGLIQTDPKITDLQTRIDILEKEAYQESKQLLTDVYLYDTDLRPEDFSEPPEEEGKNEETLKIEREFHKRQLALEEMNETVEQLRNKLLHLTSDSGEKAFDAQAPLLIADDLIKEKFLSSETRTLHYCADIFWQWDGTKYIELQEGEIRQIIYGFLRPAKKLTKEGTLENFNPNKFKVDQIIDALKAICHQNHNPANGSIWLDGRKEPDPQYLICFQNGLLDLEKWMENPTTPLIPHTPLLFNVNSLDFGFDPNAPQPQEWLEFLQNIWTEDLESQESLQEWAGYLLTQDAKQHKILLIIGPPRAGKGTIGKVLTKLLGVFNVIGPTVSSLGGEFGLQPFLNKMLALISDVRLGGKGNNIIIERLLSISGQDPLTVNRKFLPSLTAQLSTRIVMMSNELPDMKDASGALVNRYIVLSLQRSWLGKEDPTLFDRLCRELPGILLWALEGFSRLQKRGKFIQPKSSEQNIEELLAIASPIKAFFSERCIIHPQKKMPVDTLFHAWRDWCSSNGYSHGGNVQSFGKNFRAAFPEIYITRPQENGARERYYNGIAFTPPYDPSEDVRGQNQNSPD